MLVPLRSVHASTKASERRATRGPILVWALEDRGTRHMEETRLEVRVGLPVVSMNRRRIVGLLAGVTALGGGLVWDEADAKGKGKKGKKGKKKKKTKVNPFKDIAITGDSAQNGETFAGKLTIANFRFDEQQQQIFAVGTLTGIVTKSGGVTEVIASQPVEFPYDGAGPGRQRDVNAQSGTSGSLFMGMGSIDFLLVGIMFTLNSFFLQLGIGKSKARVKAVNEVMGAGNPQDVVAGLNKLRATFPA